MLQVIKKDGTLEEFNNMKIINACKLASQRALDDLSTTDYNMIVDKVKTLALERSHDNKINVSDMHYIVEKVLLDMFPNTGNSYREYRNYKKDFVHMMDKVYTKSQSIRFIGDLSNANSDATMVSTQRSLIYGYLNKTLYKKFFLNQEERQAVNDGYIYIHDMKDRLDSMNCCLFDMANVITGGFEMGNVWYNEPKTLDVAFDVIADVVLSAASQQYGGFTIPRVDSLLEPYAKKSYQKYLNEFYEVFNLIDDKDDVFVDCPSTVDFKKEAHDFAIKKVKRDLEQGFQAWEYRFNTVSSSRGDYPFTSISFGIDTSKFGVMISEAALKVRMEGQGKEGHKKPVLFPKLTFLYDENLHGEGKELEWLFDLAIDCSSKAMYPDFLSLTGDGYIPSMYKKYGKVVSLMGCRASLSPWYERGGMKPEDDEDVPIFEGRFNLGAISLHLPMILAKARQENKDFYEVLDYYLEMIRNLHKRTYDFLGEKKASTNPLAFTQGGFLGGNLNPDDKIRPLLKPMTMSFGITALNELQYLYNQKSLVEDNQFALEVMEYINKKANEFKEEDGILYAIYGTPAESLCFSGDTEVQTYDGNKFIKDIKEGDLVYSFNEEQKKIELKPVTMSKMTSKSAKVVKVEFDNGQHILCTPNHKFAKRIMVRDELGRFVKEDIEYVQALNLKPNDRIKSNYIIINSDGHYKCTTDQYLHDINAEYFLGKKEDGYVVHHIDENKLNNKIENLIYMSDSDHRRLHIDKTIQKYQFTSENSKGKNNPFYGKHHGEESKLMNKEKHIGKNNANSKAVVQISLNGDIINTFESRGMAERETGFKNLSYALNGKYKTKENAHEHGGYLWFFVKDIKDYDLNNHRVKSVTMLDTEIPVYDITVKDNHNFYVGGTNGILVHNCGLQVEQFRKKYGVVKGVSDRAYVSNSFHCGVWENITPIQKQDAERPFWDLLNGGKIQYCRYPISYNKTAIKTLVRRAMEYGYYEGINLSLAYCEDCGYEQLEMDVCPKCGSTLITKIDRMNGYLGYTRVHGKTRYNEAKNIEISERVSM